MKMNRTLSVLILSVLILSFLFAFVKPGFSQQGSWKDELPEDPTLYEIREAFDEAREAGRLTEKEVKLFKRWEYFLAPRVYPSGEPFDPEALWKAYELSQDGASEKSQAKSISKKWQYLGPSVLPQNRGGAGRTNAIEVEPGDQDEYWVGSPHGGLWHSEDGGANWEPKTDNLPNLGVTDIAIDPRDTSFMYIATGDGFGYEVSNGEFWGGTYTMGVLRSTDGGNTWNTTSLNFSETQARQIYRLVIHPEHPDTLFATTNNGIYRSTDKGVNWTKVFGSMARDLDVDPNSPNTIFAASSTSIYRSTDGGSNWNQVTGPYYGGYVSMAISPTTPDQILACMGSGEGFYISTDNGDTWVPVNTTLPGTTYGWYTSAMTASPNDQGVYYWGGVDMAVTTDSGNGWAGISDWSTGGTNYAHADHRDIEVVGSGDTLLSANDGGVFRSVNGGGTWEDISAGLELLQIYDMDAASNDPYTILAGCQDNGTNMLKNGTWSRVLGGDGTGCGINPYDNNRMFISYQNGNLSYSTTGGTSWNPTFTITNSPFVTKVEYGPDPQEPAYTGGYELRTVGDVQLTNMGSSGTIRNIGFSKYNQDFVYFTKGARTDSAGTIPGVYRFDRSTWSTEDLSSGLPILQAVPTDITAHPYDPDKIWVVFSGFSSGDKVYYTEDGGSTWNNISGSLPNVPMNTIAYDDRDTAYNGVYVGSDLGVYYRNDTTNGWKPFMDDLPKVIVMDLEIHYGVEKIRAATFGRGIWEAPLVAEPSPSSLPEKDDLFSSYRVYPNPGSGRIMLESVETSRRIAGFTLFDLQGREVRSRTAEAPLRKVEVDLEGLNSGTYFMRIDRVEGKSVTKKVIIE